MTAPDGRPTAAATCGSPSGAALVPPRPSDLAILVGYCRDCGQHRYVDPLVMTLRRHKYPKWDARDRRGRCSGSMTTPIRYAWLEPIA